jgi:hypothetical protein
VLFLQLLHDFTVKESRFNGSTLYLYDAPAYSDGDSLGAISGSKLLHDVLDVPLNGLLRDEQFYRDVAISVPARDLLKYLDFAIAQGVIAKMFRKVAKDLRGNVLLARMNSSNHLHQLFSGHTLEHVAICACLKRTLDLDVSLKGRA